MDQEGYLLTFCADRGQGILGKVRQYEGTTDAGALQQQLVPMFGTFPQYLLHLSHRFWSISRQFLGKRLHPLVHFVHCLKAVSYTHLDVYKRQGISFPNHIFEDEFEFEDKKTSALLKFNNKEEKFNVEFDSFEGYMFVCAFEKK